MIGSGAAGSVFASYLRLGGADITLVDLYKEHMDKVAKDGMDFTVEVEGSEHHHVDGFKTATSAEGIGIMDMVIFMTKAIQIKDALKTAESCIGPDTMLVSLMNGLGNEDALLKKAPPDHVLYGSGNIGTALNGPGSCTAMPMGGEHAMQFGPVEKGPVSDAAGKELERLFQTGGCSAVYMDDVKPLVWKKAIVNSVLNPLSAVTRLRIKDITGSMDGTALFLDMVSEAVAVANADGVPFQKVDMVRELRDSNARNQVMSYFPSMAQDVLIHQRTTEIDCLTGAIAKKGKKLGVPTPVCNVITKLVHTIEQNYDKQYKEGDQ